MAKVEYPLRSFSIEHYSAANLMNASFQIFATNEQMAYTLAYNKIYEEHGHVHEIHMT